MVLSIARTKSSSTKCAFPLCLNDQNLKRIPTNNRITILKNYRVFVPFEGRACPRHFEIITWSGITCSSPGLIHEYTTKQIEDMVDILRGFGNNNQLKKQGTLKFFFRLQTIIDCDYFLYKVLEEQRLKTNNVKRDTGLTMDQFNDLKVGLPSLRECYSNDRSAHDALYTYLMKMRTAQPNEDIAKFFGVSVVTVYRRLKKVRGVFERDFIPNNINYLRTHEDISNHTTQMCRILHCNNNNERAIIICDGTYIYTHKSSNFDFQKKSYNDQKKKNFVKVMMIVGSDGTIFYALGPYAATDNDAKILRDIFENSNTFNNLRAGDILILDRGFRDVTNFIRERNLVAKMPNFVQRSGKGKERKGQLTTIQANESRLVTAIRFVVETRNGHMKTIWKAFDRSWGTIPLQHMMTDFKICAGLINKYFNTFESNKELADELANRMLARVNTPNTLSTIVRKRGFETKYSRFEVFDSLHELPSLSQDDLILISLGPYQIHNAPSYVQMHSKQNNGEFVIFKVPDDITEEFCSQFNSDGRSLILLMARLKSRFQSNKKHDTFVLIDKNASGPEAVIAYCCECYNGLRTVGCCSHVMCIIWFSLHVKSQYIAHKPAAFLNDYFEINYDTEINNNDEINYHNDSESEDY